MRILLVDDHPLFRQGVVATISHINAAIIVEQYDSLGGVRDALAHNNDAGLILLDLKLSDSAGVAGLLALKALYPQLPIAIVSANDDRETIQTVSACGAAGFVSKASSLSDLTSAMTALIEGRSWFPQFTPAQQFSGLTRTQARILEGVHRGLMYKQIAHELGLSEATIKYHLAGVFQKLGVQTRAQLMALALDRSSSSN